MMRSAGDRGRRLTGCRGAVKVRGPSASSDGAVEERESADARCPTEKKDFDGSTRRRRT